MSGRRFSLGEKMWIRDRYRELGGSAASRHRQIRMEWPAQFPGNPVPPSGNTIEKRYRAIEETKSAEYRNKGRIQPPRVLTAAKLQELKDLCDAESQMPAEIKRSSGRRNNIGLKKDSWTKGIKKLGYVHHKPAETMALSDVAKVKRVTLSRWVLRRSDSFFTNLISVDETTFTMNGKWNHQQHRDRQPRGQRNKGFVHRNKKFGGGKVMCLVGCIGDGTVLPTIQVEGNLTGDKYLWYLQEVLLPFLAEPPAPPPPPGSETQAEYEHRVRQDDERRARNFKFNTGRYWWQQDGASSHSTLPVLTFLGDMFRKRVVAHKGRRVIGLPATNYPPDSPDLLQVPDIYLNDAMKRYVYHEGGAPRSMDELRAKIAMAGDHVDREAIRKCFRKSKARAQACIDADGDSFPYKRFR